MDSIDRFPDWPGWFIQDLLKKYEYIPDAYKGLFLEGYKKASKSEDKKEAIERYFSGAWTYGSSSSSSSSMPKEKPLNEDEVIYE